MKDFLRHFISVTCDLILTRFIGFTIAFGCALTFGLGILICGALMVEYSSIQEELLIELAISSVIALINVGFFFVVAKLWKKSNGVREFYFSISPKVWLGISVVSWFGGVASGFWLFS